MGASLPPKEANLFKLIVVSSHTEQSCLFVYDRLQLTTLSFVVPGFYITAVGYSVHTALVAVGLCAVFMKLFSCFKSYETKQYKKGLKAADAILKKFPDHGDREYREAIKCYRNALKIDPDNIEILRDLSLLQVDIHYVIIAQMRDLSGFVETRQQLLTLKPNHRMNWIGFAVAHHLNSNAAKAIEILEAYEGTLEDDYPPDNERCEHGEMLLYKVSKFVSDLLFPYSLSMISLLEECGLTERALEELYKKEGKIVDKLAFKEQQVSLLVKLGHLEEGEQIYRALLNMIPDNYRYYEGLQKCLGLYSENGQYSSEEMDQLDALYKSLRKQYTWSSAVKRIPLDFLQDDKFYEAADNYIRPLLTKVTMLSFHSLVEGVPSLFSDLSPLYDHPGQFYERAPINSYVDFVFTGPGSISPVSSHYDRRGQHDLAVAKIDEALKHTPTVIDLYSAKGRILKHAGDMKAAAALADEARSMDLADRYINSECVKRMLQADQAVVILLANYLNLRILTRYELASGESYFRQGDLGRALKKFLAVEKHYADMTEDQFDFHSYCLRKMTLRAYVEMLKFQDRLHSHRYFHKAAAGAVLTCVVDFLSCRCYIKLYDSPSKSAAVDDGELSGLLPSQKKKLRQKQRKAEARAKKAEEKNEEESGAAGASKTGKKHVKLVDLDPHGEKLLQVEDPLAEGTKYLKLLLKNSSSLLETHLLSFELNMRKQRILLAFQAVKQLLKLDPENPNSHCCLFGHLSHCPSAKPNVVSIHLIHSLVQSPELCWFTTSPNLVLLQLAQSWEEQRLRTHHFSAIRENFPLDIRFFHHVSKLPAPTTDSEKLVWSVLEAERPSLSQLHEKSLVEANRNFLEKHKEKTVDFYCHSFTAGVCAEGKALSPLELAWF
ncbi:N-alpha-acetyltransferase 16, NatA auxiliary subunit [Asimina triloba]